jgi:MFS family permease
MTLLVGLLIAAAVMGGATLLFAMRSDRWGRKRLSAGAAVAVVVWAFPLFLLLQTRNPVLLTVGLVGGLLCFAMLYGPMGAYLPELFRVRYRYSGASIAYSVPGVIGGGVVPLVSTALWSWTGSSTPVSVLLIGLGVISFVSVLGLPETLGHDFSDGLAGDSAATVSDPAGG